MRRPRKDVPPAGQLFRLGLPSGLTQRVHPQVERVASELPARLGAAQGLSRLRIAPPTVVCTPAWYTCAMPGYRRRAGKYDSYSKRRRRDFQVSPCFMTLTATGCRY